MLIKKIKKHFQEVLEIKTSPHSIALGFAIGTFIGILPTPGFGILLAFIITLIFPKISKIALFGSLIFWNPLMALPIQLFGIKIGNFLLGSEPIIKYEIEFFNTIYNFSRRLLLGNLILATIISPITYFLIKLTVKRIQNK